MSGKIVADFLPPSPLAGEGWDGGDSVSGAAQTRLFCKVQFT